jgi:5-methylcytosine-specific restriction protein A
MTTQRIRGHALQRIRERLLRANPLCALCAKQCRVAAATEVDHIVPLFRGGIEDDSNRQGLCAECHARKTAEDLGHMQHGGCDLDGNPNVPWPARKRGRQ